MGTSSITALLKRAKGEAIRWLATTLPLAAIMVLQSCSALAGAIPGAEMLTGTPTPAESSGGACTPETVARLEVAAAKLQCTPAAVHDQVTAERDAAEAALITLRLEIRAQESELADLRAAYGEAVNDGVAVTAERDQLIADLAEANESVAKLAALLAQIVPMDPAGKLEAALDALVK